MNGCPDDPVCHNCPCADEDDVCFPGERLRADRDRYCKALERIARGGPLVNVSPATYALGVLRGEQP